MKKKELTKLLAVVLSTVMIGGSAAPAMAADVTGEDTAETYTEEVTDVEDVAEDEVEDVTEPEVQDVDLAEAEDEGESLFSDSSEDESVPTDLTQGDADSTVNQELTLTGTLFNTSQNYESTARTATVTENTATIYGKVTGKCIDLVFESTDAAEKGTDTTADYKSYIKLKPVLQEEGATIEIAGGVKSSGDFYSNSSYTADGGYFTFVTSSSSSSSSSYGYLAAGRGPAAATKTLYVKVTHADESNTVDWYKLNITRKGYESVTANYGLSEDKAWDGIWGKYDEETGLIKSSATTSMLARWMGLTVYDKDGKRVNDPTVTFQMNPDYTGDQFYIDEDGYFCSRGAGASGEAIQAVINGKTYPVYLKAKYTSTTSDRAGLINARATDGTTVLNEENFPTAGDFAALFPEKDQEKAAEFYDLVMDCRDALAVSGSGEGTWDYSIATSGEKKFWDENCESAKLNKIIAMAASVWANIYGMQDAKDALAAYADVENASESKKEELNTELQYFAEKLETAYQNGEITKTEDVQALVDDEKAAVYALDPRLGQCEVTLDATEFTYDGTAKTPAVTVKNGETVVAPEDYTVEYAENTKAGTATVTVTGKEGKLTGTTTLTFTIVAAEQEIKGVEAAYSKTAGDAAFALNPTAAEGAAFTYTTDNEKVATVDEKGNVTPAAAGTAVITIKATAENYKDAELKVTVNVAAKEDPAIVSVAKTSYTKTQGNKAFTLSVKKNMTSTVTYKSSKKAVVTVDKNGKVTVKAPGRAVITVTAKATGVKTQIYKINVTVKPSVKLGASAKSTSKKSIKVTWKRNKKVTGYQVIVAKDKNLKKVVKKATITKNTKLATTIKNLKSGKKYYVAVRAYKKATGGTVYGSWTTAKAVKTK